MIAKRLVRSGLKSLGLSVQRIRQPAAASPPPLFEDPIEALRFEQGGKHAAFRCPLDSAGDIFGFGFSRSSWHPFVAALREYGAGLARSFDGSILETYYETWQPQGPTEFWEGLSPAPSCLPRFPRPDVFVAPWSALTIAEERRRKDRWYRHDFVQYGIADVDPDRDGLTICGPTASRVGRIEYRRLTGIFDSLRANGYDRSRGDVRVETLKRGGELRFLSSGGGYHRVSAMAALGERTVPARFRRPFLIDVDDVDDWPNVRSGMWSRHEAVRYVDFLFDFDRREWAREKALLTEQ